MERLNHILELLYDRGEGFFSLEELSAAAGVEPAEMNEHLEALREKGQELDFSPDKGVRLVRPVRLDPHLIERGLETRRIAKSVLCFSEVDSTNDVAFDSVLQGGTDGLVVLGEFQRLGRGRLGRRWICPPGANILLSVLLINSKAALSHEALTIAAGLAVSEAIEDACGLGSQLRWPNDVLLEGAKTAGVLVELRNISAQRAAVVGIGINANASPDPAQVDMPATDIAEHLGHPVERTEVIRALLARLDEWIVTIEAGKLEHLHERWVARCGMMNQRVTVLSGGRRHVGRVLDVSPLEGLVLSCDDGRRVYLPAAGSTLESCES